MNNFLFIGSFDDFVFNFSLYKGLIDSLHHVLNFKLVGKIVL